MNKNNIGKENDAFKIGEDGTIIRLNKLELEPERQKDKNEY